MPCSAERCLTYAAAPPPVSSLLKRMNRIERSVSTSGELKNARDLHHERRAGAVVVRSRAEAVAVHVRADDVHLLRMRRADLRAVDLFARPRRVPLRVDATERRVGLEIGIRVDAGPRRDIPSRDCFRARGLDRLRVRPRPWNHHRRHHDRREPPRDSPRCAMESTRFVESLRSCRPLYSYLIRSVFVQP